MKLMSCWIHESLGQLKMFEIEEYLHYNTLLDGDLHVLIPKNKIIACKCPLKLADNRSTRSALYMSPGKYTQAFYKNYKHDWSFQS